MSKLSEQLTTRSSQEDSLAGDVRVSRTFRPISPVKMMLSRQALEQL